MKIEFIADGAQDAPLILFHSGTPEEVAALHGAVRGLAGGEVESVEIHRLDGMEPGDIAITARVTGRNLGVVQDDPAGSFLWSLTSACWDNVEGLLGPFREPRSSGHGHQYLDDTGEITAAISTDSGW